MRRILATLLILSALALTDEVASAQQTSSPIQGITTSRLRELIDNKDWHFVGDVELEMSDAKLYADEVWFNIDEHQAIATGNVLFTQGDNRISADRAELDTETRLGTFYNAWGIASIQPSRRTAAVGGFVAPQMAGQETDMYFFGDKIEKIGPKKYRISNGSFTTCVQPSPRWNLHADTVVLNIDHYTLLRQAVFKVKGVPLFYTPILYYPTNKEGRATGFLLPTYGSSTVHGQTFSNAFFWAIDRSQDATFTHDWFSKTGQGWGSEYRYAAATGDANLRTYVLNQHESIFALPDGSSGTTPESHNFEIRGGASQLLPRNLRMRARADYFSNVTTMQTFHTNVAEVSRNRRTYGANVVGSWRAYSLNATFDRNEYFSEPPNSVLAGSTPRVSFTRTERPLFQNSGVYLSVGSEFAHFERESRQATRVLDSGLARFDFNPQIRYPFKKWQWFTVNSSVSWRDTFYTRSLVPATQTEEQKIVDDNLNRTYFTLTTQAVGPVFNRVWNTPGSRYAERLKHTIEPFLTVRRTSAIDDFKRIVRTDGVDAVVGGATSYTYGVNNRIYARRRIGQTGQAQEIINVELRQSYYSDELSSQADQQYTTTYNSAVPSHFSPISLTVRATPLTSLQATLRAEVDSRYFELKTMSASGSYNWTTRLQTTVGWNQRFLIEELPGFNDPNTLDHFVNVNTRARTADNRFGSNYSFNYDVRRSAMLQQRMTAFYNAQCCGIAFEYQTFNYGGARRFLATPSDRRFFLSFTLAGLGNFSPFSGAMETVPR